MKTVKVQGGLGNQLFCVAFARSMSILTGETVGLDVASYGSDRYARRFALNELATRMGGLRIVRRPLLARRAVGALLRRAKIGGYVGEGRAPADLPGLQGLAARGAYFDGYWQNEAYFADPAGLRASLREHLESQGGPATAHDLVVHFRAYGDERRADRRGAPDADYVAEAIARIEVRSGPVGQIMLVSDDPAAALERLAGAGRPLVPVGGASPQADMAVLLAARNLVLCNSSFSWWAGYCGDAVTVVYPERRGFFHYPMPAARFTVL